MRLARDLPETMNSGAFLLTVVAIVFIIVIVTATLQTKVRQRRIRKALGLPARMETSTAEAQARQAVRVFEQTDLRLTTTAPRLSKEERRKMATAIVREKGLLPKVTPRRTLGSEH
jgi:alcohol dehydrogenase class IV